MRLFAQMRLSRTFLGPFLEPVAIWGVPSKDQLPLTHERRNPRVAPSAALRAGVRAPALEVPGTLPTVQGQLPRRDM